MVRGGTPARRARSPMSLWFSPRDALPAKRWSGSYGTNVHRARIVRPPKELGEPPRNSESMNRRIAWMASTAGALALAFPGSPGAAESGQRVLAVLGPEQVVFDWTTDRCVDLDLPDVYAHAIRDDGGRIVLASGNAPDNHFMFGDDFDGLERSCTPVLHSGDRWKAEDLDHQEWITSVYTEDGRTVHALVHNEYHDPFDPRCKPGDTSPANPCWYNFISSARSDDGGRTFSQAPSPEHLVAILPFPWDPDPGGRRPGAIPGVHGYLEPSNIVQGPDGAFYSVFAALTSPTDAAKRGTCVMRTHDVSDPSSWRLWDGDGYDIPLTNPYDDDPDDPTALCAFVSPETIRSLRGSLTYNTALERFMLVGSDVFPNLAGTPTCGFWLSLSRDLVEWEPPQLIRETALPFPPCDSNLVFRARGIQYEAYPSIIDHEAPDRSFTLADRTAHLYFMQNRGTPANGYLDRDLVRQRVLFV